MTPPPPLLFISLLSSLSNLSGIEAFAPWRGSSLLSQNKPYLPSDSFQCRGPTTTNLLSHEEQSRNHDNQTPAFSSPSNRSSPSRRAILQSATASLVTLATADPASSLPDNPFAPPPPQPFRPSSRCTAYLVDSTIPPSLIPYRAGREASILKNLGMGSGTSKEPFSRDDVNLNNFMNKAVFGAIDATKGALGGISDVIGGENTVDRYASFVFFGANFDAESPTARGDANADADLAVGLMKDICRPKERSGNTAVGVAFVPISAQSALDEYVVGSGGEAASLDRLMGALKSVGVDTYLAERYVPIFQFAQEKKIPLLALSPELQDLDVIRNKGGGLQSLDPQRREVYVADAEGFIALTRDPKFQLYTEKSLLKDFTPSSPTISEEQFKAEQANFFAERILVHETAATVITKWAAPRPNSLVITLAPIADVRFMGGMNGRVPRVYRFLNGDKSGGNEGRGVGEDAVTTILLNPSAQETLSESRFLRLEIGTAPNNWAYQTKIADYFWFSSMPKVNMLPRMMNEQ
ncbi:hypothetical protein HJC23_001116 [Cyclotella cryptica]|uniref:Haem-binding uptake Tiki superfamily ChaN domain-containing protein n=1 Tax=Cyclotella cryptica TaxID=29204 RepID=A0ABD3QID0_9STRA|eukprot:CCRYP_005086-RA/>CCRYP_005086-RA protein AED:0.26 eAED:0.26 QI:142/1/1/1/1/1/2/523/522